MTGQPTVSVIVPTRNRAAQLLRTLDALAAQTHPLDDMEVVVVADGCTDATRGRVAAWRSPLRLRFIEQDSSGPAAARNRGAAAAQGAVLLFLDDDVEAWRGLVAAHLREQGRGPARVIIGYLPAVGEGRGFFPIALRGWWESMFDGMRQPGYRYTYRNLLTGNFSVPAWLFAAAGGFDPSLRCHEDYELGVRLIDAGAVFTFAPDAGGHHRERTDLSRSLQRKFDEGQADVQMVRRHPALAAGLPLAWADASSPVRRLLHAAAFRWPAGGRLLVGCLRARLRLLEALRLRYRWRNTLDHLLTYYYWRGLAEAVGTPQAVAALIESCRTAASAGGLEIDLDLEYGLSLEAGVARAEERLDRERPAAATIRFGEHRVGRIPPQPGAEPLRGAHLRRLLATAFAGPLLRALALSGDLPPVIEPSRVLAACRSVRPAAGRPPAVVS